MNLYKIYICYKDFNVSNKNYLKILSYEKITVKLEDDIYALLKMYGWYMNKMEYYIIDIDSYSKDLQSYKFFYNLFLPILTQINRVERLKLLL